MNILFLSELFYPNGSGAELATFLYAKLLSEAGFNITVVTNRFGGESELSRNKNLTIRRLPLFEASGSVKYSILKRFDVLFSSYLRKMIEWSDAVYIPRFWYSAIPLSKLYGKPVVTHLHDYIPICSLSIMRNLSQENNCKCNSLVCSPKCIFEYEKRKGRNFKETLISIVLNSSVGKYYPKLVKFSDAVICVSKTQEKIIIEEEPSLAFKTHTVYNPIPEHSNVDLEGDDFGYFGGSDFLKGFSVLYQAVKYLKNTKKKLLKIHATKFSDQNKHVTEFLNELGFSLYAHLSENEYKTVYSKIQTIIVPSIWHEPWPYVTVEALTNARFVVASRIGGMPEQVEGCKGTVLCEPGNYQDLANAIEYVQSLKRENVIDLGIQNKEAFFRRFSNEVTVKKFIKIVDRLT